MAAIIRHLFANEELTQRAKSVFGSTIVDEAYLCVLKEDDGDDQIFRDNNDRLSTALTLTQPLLNCLDSEYTIAVKFNNGHIVEIASSDALMLERVDQEEMLII